MNNIASGMGPDPHGPRTGLAEYRYSIYMGVAPLVAPIEFIFFQPELGPQAEWVTIQSRLSKSNPKKLKMHTGIDAISSFHHPDIANQEEARKEMEQQARLH